MFFTKSPFVFLFFSPLISMAEATFAERVNPHLIAQEYLQLAENLAQEKKTDKALAYYEKSIEIYGKDYLSYFKFANFLFDQGRIDGAAQNYRKAIEFQPDIPQLHYNLGVCYSRLKDIEAALDHLRKAVQLKPDYTKAQLELSHCLEQKKEYQEATAILQKIAVIEPQSSDIHRRLGRLYNHLEDLENAEQSFKKALSLSPHDATTLLELGNTLNMLDKPHEAINHYMHVLEQYPYTKSALYNFGYSLKQLGRTKEALMVYKKTLELYPDYPLGHFAIALAQLALGDFENGWKEYEWRWKAYDETPRKFSQPEWQGQDVTGKTIFIYAEQGLGDTYQFIRYAKILKEKGATIIFETQKPLESILSLCPYLDHVIPRNAQKPEFDYHIALMSLPLIFNTRLETVPQNIPYLYADHALTAYWHAKLSHDTNFKVGICWQGNAHYQTLSLRRAVAAKSINLATLAPLSTIPGVSIYSLQKIDGTEQLTSLDQHYTIRSFGPEMDTINGRFMDTAAIMLNLDLIITIDTATCHLAGGLGCKNIWLLLPEPADWRWLEGTNETPWYPNMTLFRQRERGNWDHTIEIIKQEITSLIENNHHKNQDISEKISNSIKQIIKK